MAKRVKSRGRKLVGRIVTLLIAALAAFVGWNYISPMLSSGSVVTYESHTVSRGDIETGMSFSATISVINTETLTASSQTTLRELYVEESQQVKEGDKLAQLANGDVLTASFDGIVNEIRIAVGDRVRFGGPVMQVCDIEHLQVSMNVDEYDIANVRVGQQCEVTVIPLGITFETEIKHIDRVSASMGTVAYYTATMDADVPESVLPGMQSTVTIPENSVQDVLLLPMEALSFDEDGTPYVFEKTADGSYQRVDITVGLNDGVHVEITSGVAEGDTVWSVSGTEESEPAFTVEGLYKQLVGETIVINEHTERSQQRGGRGEGEQREGMEMPEGMELPEGMEMPARQSEGGSAPSEGTSDGSSAPSQGGQSDAQNNE